MPSNHYLLSEIDKLRTRVRNIEKALRVDHSQPISIETARRVADHAKAVSPLSATIIKKAINELEDLLTKVA